MVTGGEYCSTVQSLRLALDEKSNDQTQTLLLVLLREADLAGVAEYRCLSGQVHFTDIF
jgi:hypothetical protein